MILGSVLEEGPLEVETDLGLSNGLFLDAEGSLSLGLNSEERSPGRE